MFMAIHTVYYGLNKTSISSFHYQKHQVAIFFFFYKLIFDKIACLLFLAKNIWLKLYPMIHLSTSIVSAHVIISDSNETASVFYPDIILNAIGRRNKKGRTWGG